MTVSGDIKGIEINHLIDCSIAVIVSQAGILSYFSATPRHLVVKRSKHYCVNAVYLKHKISLSFTTAYCYNVNLDSAACLGKCPINLSSVNLAPGHFVVGQFIEIKIKYQNSTFIDYSKVKINQFLNLYFEFNTCFQPKSSQ